MSVMNINKILKSFIDHYPMLEPSKLYKIQNGFLIYAPILKNETDYSNPYYFISSDLSIANPFNMKYRKQMFKAFEDGPIWKR